MGEDLRTKILKGSTGKIWIADVEVGEVKEFTVLPNFEEKKRRKKQKGASSGKRKTR